MAGILSESNLPLRHCPTDNLNMTTSWTLRVGIGVCFLLSGAAIAQNPPDEKASVSETEYEVFSAYISQSFVGSVGEDRVGKTVSQIVIVNHTESDKKDLDDFLDPQDMPPGGSVENYLRKEVPRLRTVTIDNFHRANVTQAQLTPRFHLPMKYQLVSPEKIGSIVKGPGDWPDFYKQYPGAQGHLWLSRVGFSPDRKQALFYVGNWCSGKCGTGSYVVMEKHGAMWKTIKEVFIWMS
jgi:hypothetical protein